MNIFKILCLLQVGDKDQFSVAVADQKTFLESLGEAYNDIDRGFKQYLCQHFFVPRWKVWLFNIVAAFTIPFVVLFYLIKGLFVKKDEPVETIIERKGMEEVIPAIVREKYKPDCRYWKQSASMSIRDLTFLKEIIVHAPRHPYFVLKSWMNVMYYSDMIRRHDPKVLIQFGEYSFSSSILTEYCHRNDIRHINIMHGEKLWFIRDAFFHYDECYVWNEFYVELFRSLKAEPTQFIVALPESMQITISEHINKNAFANYKYYLAVYSEEQIKSIIKSMAFAQHEGKTVKYRPHPRYSDLELLRKYVDDAEIESPNSISILDSISNLEYAVGSYTTVLSQAYFSGKRVILDDVTFKEQYIKLNSLSYILTEKKLETLSKYQRT